MRKRPLFAGYGQRHLPDVRVFVLLDAAGRSTVRRSRAGRRRRLPQPPGPRRRTERARSGDGGILRRRTGFGVAAAAALGAPGCRCVVALATVVLVTAGLRRPRRIRRHVSGRRTAAVVAAVAGAVAMATVARTQIHLVVDLADKTFRRDWMRVARFVFGR